MSFKCPDGHDSTTNDYCSECSLEMHLAVKVDQDASVDVDAASREYCPNCKTERDGPSTAFCGVCGYNFVSRQSGDVVLRTVTTPPAVANTTAARPERVSSASVASHIEIEVTFDESNADAPKGAPPRRFSLYDDESLIGRRSNSILQTVGLDGDDCISRRHLLIIRQRSGSYVARLFDNTNGGTLNGVEMTAGVEAPVAEGDKIVIGSFTIIRVTGIR